MDNKERFIEEKSNQLADVASKLPESTQFALINVLPNIVNGCHWGFTSKEQIEDFYDGLKADKNVILRALKGGYLVVLPQSYILGALQRVDNTLVTPSDITLMQRGLAKGYASFEKYIAKNKVNAKDEMILGIYCINDTSAITYQGKRYPAFRIDIKNAFNLLQGYGYLVNVGGAWVTPANASNSKDFWNSLVVSPTRTGCFIKVKADSRK